MTELEQARAHLRRTQAELYRIRTLPESDLTPLWISDVKGSVLAALSWVWDAQEREERECRRWIEDRFESALLECLCLSAEPIRYDDMGIELITSAAEKAASEAFFADVQTLADPASLAFASLMPPCFEEEIV